LPLTITRKDREEVTQSGVTKNISSGGVLFGSETEAELGTSVEFVITLSGSLNQIVNLRCFGNIVRCNQTASGEQPRYDIAASLERYEFIRE
jgi:hypothetical protein